MTIQLIEPPPPTTSPRTCTRCGDPLPVDGACDCAGDPDRDQVAGYAGMRPHSCIIRWFGEEYAEEVWI